MLPDLKLDDHLRLRKAHPCGGLDWKVLRVGADIKIECITCNRQVMLTRRELAKRTRMVLPRNDDRDQQKDEK